MLWHGLLTIGQPGLYMEDLYVIPSFRGNGIGRALLQKLAALALDRRCDRFEISHGGACPRRTLFNYQSKAKNIGSFLPRRATL